MQKIFDDIKAFHEKFGLAYDGKPRAVDSHTEDFRHKFGMEELNEYQKHNGLALEAAEVVDQAEYTHHLEEVLDSFVDQLYVLAGTVYLHGMQHTFQEAWDRVHAANMAKVRASAANVSKRGSSLDVVKPEGWTAPKHSDLVEDNDLK